MTCDNSVREKGEPFDVSDTIHTDDEDAKSVSVFLQSDFRDRNRQLVDVIR